MAENLIVALQITLAGMAVVAGVMGLVWILMVVLVRVTGDHAVPEVTSAASDLEQRAAAVAVAVVLALRPASGARTPSLPPTASVSPWQAAMRASQLRQRGRVR
jgi:hypothetical protein